MSTEKGIDFRKRPLVFIDLETTGLNIERHEVIEVGCIVANGETFEVIETLSAKTKPKHIETADPEALKINGYSADKWRDARELKEVLLKVAKIAPGGIIAGWNVYFDWGFLAKNFKRLKIRSKFDYHVIDVQSIAYASLYGVKDVKRLGTRPIASHFGIKLGDVHNAEEDIRTTYEIFKILMKR